MVNCRISLFLMKSFQAGMLGDRQLNHRSMARCGDANSHKKKNSFINVSTICSVISIQWIILQKWLKIISQFKIIIIIWFWFNHLQFKYQMNVLHTNNLKNKNMISNTWASQQSSKQFIFVNTH